MWRPKLTDIGEEFRSIYVGNSFLSSTTASAGTCRAQSVAVETVEAYYRTGESSSEP
jgi:hypothetical protein